MANYTYECLDCTNQTDVSHGMLEEPTIECDECGALMIKLPPQRTTIAIAPWDVLYKKMDDKYVNYRKKKERMKKNGRASV